ncbi:MAG: hypothetical protein JRG83_15890 [Deltaproteobacteria bacterium]|nr:hypothetical protein [Deltaproteobacteria bacterium]
MASRSTDPPDGGSQALLRAAARLLRPLVRLLIAHQITYPTLSRLTKGLYVEVARDEFALPNRPMSQSRVSLLTGVHRKDVRTMWDEPRPANTVPASVSLGSQIVRLWSTDDRFLDANGRPRALARTPQTSDEPSFDELVNAVTQDVWPRVILDEWFRLGVVQLDGQERVALQRDAYVPEHGFDEKVFFLGRNVGDHLAAGGANVQGREEPFLEREVHYRELRPESVEELSRMARELGSDALQKINRRGAQLKKRDERDRDAKHRVAFGVYFFNELEKPGDEDTTS